MVLRWEPGTRGSPPPPMPRLLLRSLCGSAPSRAVSTTPMALVLRIRLATSAVGNTSSFASAGFSDAASFSSVDASASASPALRARVPSGPSRAIVSAYASGVGRQDASYLSPEPPFLACTCLLRPHAMMLKRKPEACSPDEARGTPCVNSLLASSLNANTSPWRCGNANSVPVSSCLKLKTRSAPKLAPMVKSSFAPSLPYA